MLSIALGYENTAHAKKKKKGILLNYGEKKVSVIRTVLHLPHLLKEQELLLVQFPCMLDFERVEVRMDKKVKLFTERIPAFLSIAVQEWAAPAPSLPLIGSYSS